MHHRTTIVLRSPRFSLIWLTSSLVWMWNFVHRFLWSFSCISACNCKSLCSISCNTKTCRDYESCENVEQYYDNCEQCGQHSISFNQYGWSFSRGVKDLSHRDNRRRPLACTFFVETTKSLAIKSIRLKNHAMQPLPAEGTINSSHTEGITVTTWVMNTTSRCDGGNREDTYMLNILCVLSMIAWHFFN